VASFCCGWLRSEENHQLTIQLAARDRPERTQYPIGFRSYDPPNNLGARLALARYDDATSLLVP